MHPEPYQDDHRYLEHCLQVGKDKLKGTLLLFADREGSLEKMPELCRKLSVVSVAGACLLARTGCRRLGSPRCAGCGRWRAITDWQCSCTFEPRYAPGFEPLIREFTKTKVIIDHMGRPFQGTPDEHAVVAALGPLRQHGDEALVHSRS